MKSCDKCKEELGFEYFLLGCGHSICEKCSCLPIFQKQKSCSCLDKLNNECLQKIEKISSVKTSDFNVQIALEHTEEGVCSFTTNIISATNGLVEQTVKDMAFHEENLENRVNSVVSAFEDMENVIYFFFFLIHFKYSKCLIYKNK
jgi:hypothetical protein